MVLPTVFLANSCTIQKRYRSKKFSFTGGSGTPTVGQTLTGTTSTKTAIIKTVATGYFLVKTLSGTFTTTETISTTTWSGTLSAQADHLNTSGEYEYYWSDNQTGVTCRFSYTMTGKGETIHESGQLLDQPLKCLFPSTTTIDLIDYRIVTTDAGFAGTYDIASLYPVTAVTALNHYTAFLRKVSV